MNKQKLIVLVLIIIVALALPLTIYLVQQQQKLRSQAAPATVLSFSPTSKTVNVDDEGTVEIRIDTGENLVTAVDLTITIENSSNLKELKIEPLAGALSKTLIAGKISGSTATIVVGAEPGSPAQGANVPVAKFTFKGGKTGKTKLTFDSLLIKIAGVSEGSNVFKQAGSPAEITIAAASPTATPTQSVSPTPTASAAAPTPTPTTVVGGPITQPTATPQTQITAAPTATSTQAPSGKGGQPLPEAGIVTPTTFFLGIGTLLLIVGGALLFL